MAVSGFGFGCVRKSGFGDSAYFISVTPPLPRPKDCLSDSSNSPTPSFQTRQVQHGHLRSKCVGSDLESRFLSSRQAPEAGFQIKGYRFAFRKTRPFLECRKLGRRRGGAHHIPVIAIHARTAVVVSIVLQIIRKDWIAQGTTTCQSTRNQRAA